MSGPTSCAAKCCAGGDRRKVICDFLPVLLFDLLVPVVQLILDWVAYRDYAVNGELSGLVAPHSRVTLAYLVLCLPGTLITLCKLGYVVYFHRHAYKRQAAPRSLLDAFDHTPRKRDEREENKQSEWMCHLPVTWIWAMFRGNSTSSSMMKCSELATCDCCSRVIDQSEYWIDMESLDTATILAHSLPLRVLQMFFLCKPRSVLQVTAAAWSVVAGVISIVSTFYKRGWKFYCKNSGGSAQENWCNAFWLLIRTLLIITAVVFGLYVSVDEANGPPPWHVYVQKGSSPASLCYNLHGPKVTNEPFIITDVVQHVGLRDTCVVPQLTEDVCTNHMCTNKTRSPVYVTFQLDENTHQLYYVSSVKSNSCKNAAHSYNAVLIEHNKGMDRNNPPKQLQDWQLDKKAPSGEAEDHGRCEVNNPKPHNQHSTIRVKHSCIEERWRTCLERELLDQLPSNFNDDEFVRKYPACI